METLGYVTAATLTAAVAAIAVLAAMSVSDMRRYVKIKRM
jgi:hypothetical protein